MYRVIARTTVGWGILLATLWAFTQVSKAQDGVVVTDLGGDDLAWEAVIQVPGGGIVSTGTSGQYFGATRHLSDGTFDNSFAALVDFGSGVAQYVTSTVAQPDGKIIVAGTADFDKWKPFSFWDTRFAIARLTTNGALDTSFARGGTVTTKFAKDTRSLLGKVLLQDDGKIVAVGHTYHNPSKPSPSRIALSRYLPKGKLDSKFGSRGLVHLAIPNASVRVGAAAIQDDGKILVGGMLGPAYDYDFLLTRFHTDGSVDTAFGDNGIVRIDAGKEGEKIREIVVPDNGQILTVGIWSGGQPGEGGWPYPDCDFAVMRFDPNGQLDSTFGQGGIVLEDLFDDETDEELMCRVDLQPDGKILVGGTHFSFDIPEAYMIRYNDDGTRDGTFGNPDGAVDVPPGFEGVVLGPVGTVVRDIVLYPETDGFSILAVGHTGVDVPRDFTLSRFFSDGTLDLLFGLGF